MTRAEDRYYAAMSERPDLHEPRWSVADEMRDAAKDARDASRRGERVVGDRWVPEEDVPGRDEL